MQKQIKKECERIRRVYCSGKTATDRTIKELIRGRIAPAAFDKYGRGKMPLGIFKCKLLAGEFASVVDDFIYSSKLEAAIKYRFKAAELRSLRHERHKK